MIYRSKCAGYPVYFVEAYDSPFCTFRHLDSTQKTTFAAKRRHNRRSVHQGASKKFTCVLSPDAGASAEGCGSARMLRWQDLRGLRNEDRVVDFSFAGYQQSCRPLPPHTALRPSQVLQSTQDGRDRAKDIQMAIDEIASQGGGVLQLGPGPFVLETDALQLPSGLILQGHADGPEPTVFVIQGRNRAAVMIGPKESQRPEFKHKTQIRDQYIGAGAHCITGKRFALLPVDT